MWPVVGGAFPGDGEVKEDGPNGSSTLVEVAPPACGHLNFKCPGDGAGGVSALSCVAADE